MNDITQAVQNAIGTTHVHTIADNFVVARLQTSWPKASKNSPAAKRAAVDDMLAKARAEGRELTREQAEDQVSANIKLFPDGELAAIKTPFYAFDTWLRKRTIGFMGQGQLLLNIDLIDEAERRFADMQLQVLPMIETFKAEYSRMLDRLENRGGYFNRADYPTQTELDAKFNIQLTFYPVQNPDDFAISGLSPQQVESLRQRLSDNIAEAAEVATKDWAHKLMANMRQLADKTSGADGKRFKADSWLDTLQAAIDSQLNVSGAPEVDSALTDISLAASAVTDYIKAEGLEGQREQLKQTTHQAANDAAKKLAAFL